MMVHDQCRGHFLGQPWEPPDLYTMPGDWLPLPELPDQPTPPEIPDPEGEREPGGSWHNSEESEEEEEPESSSSSGGRPRAPGSDDA